VRTGTIDELNLQVAELTSGADMTGRELAQLRTRIEEKVRLYL